LHDVYGREVLLSLKSLETLRETNIADLGVKRAGKVRDVYVGKEYVALVSSDRFSAFNILFDEPIPDKGRVLNGISKYWFDHTQDIIENHLIDMPDPNVFIVKKCRPLLLEVIVRKYLCGSLWRDYEKGLRIKCGEKIPDGLKENDPLPKPIITPSRKSKDDLDVLPTDLINEGIVSKDQWSEISDKAIRLFERGQELSKERGLMLIDTKYEFGMKDGQVMLMDEIHTPDSSRYFYLDGYEERQQNGEPQKQLSKEFLREWLMDNDFQGLDGQTLPDLPDSFRLEVYERYSELFGLLTGKKFNPRLEKDFNNVLAEILNDAK
jgi:phosphoribosylaminoimidazole-succinocarboxamide synthase